MIMAQWGDTFAPPLLSQIVPTHSRQLPDFDGACLIISTSMVILTSSPPTTPSLSKVAFHFTPKSWRLTRPERLLRRLADADFFQQIRKNLQARGRHVPELAFVKILNRMVEGF
jgi:hypothetical protein